MQPFVRIQAEPFDIAEETARLRVASRQVGALTTFVGVVRDINDDAAVSALYLEHYPGMTERQILEIIAEASSRWDIIGASVIHRIGLLLPADDIVFVGVAGSHRGATFDACEFIIDYLKTRATFWKREHTPAGERWLTTRKSDIETADTYQRDVKNR